MTTLPTTSTPTSSTLTLTFDDSVIVLPFPDNLLPAHDTIDDQSNKSNEIDNREKHTTAEGPTTPFKLIYYDCSNFTNASDLNRYVERIQNEVKAIGIHHNKRIEKYTLEHCKRFYLSEDERQTVLSFISDDRNESAIRQCCKCNHHKYADVLSNSFCISRVDRQQSDYFVVKSHLYKWLCRDCEEHYKDFDMTSFDAV